MEFGIAFSKFFGSLKKSKKARKQTIKRESLNVLYVKRTVRKMSKRQLLKTIGGEYEYINLQVIPCSTSKATVFVATNYSNTHNHNFRQFRH